MIYKMLLLQLVQFQLLLMHHEAHFNSITQVSTMKQHAHQPQLDHGVLAVGYDSAQWTRLLYCQKFMGYIMG